MPKFLKDFFEVTGAVVIIVVCSILIMMVIATIFPNTRAPQYAPELKGLTEEIHLLRGEIKELKEGFTVIPHPGGWSGNLTIDTEEDK